MVAQVCKTLGVPHQILTVAWATKPESAIQERARTERYKLLGGWAKERGLKSPGHRHITSTTRPRRS